MKAHLAVRLLPIALPIVLGLIFPAVLFANTFVAFGPTPYLRDTGAPAAVSQTFSVLDPNTSYTLRIDSDKVSSAIVTLNGVVIFKESDFNANVEVLTKLATLQATNQLIVEMRGRPGESMTVQITGLDDVSPVITAKITPAPNVAGWNNSDATVTFECADQTSGIASCSAPVTVSSETLGQTVIGTAVDKAGNSATASVMVKLDKTSPAITITSPANGTTVVASPLTITGTVTDLLSGINSVTCNGTAATVVGSSISCSVALVPGSNVITVVATDLAGNSATSTVTVNFSPVKVTITSPPNLAYLNITPTTVTGTVDPPNATVAINSIPAVVANGVFTVALPLAEGPNIVTATATSTTGAVGTASIEVTLDMTPPHVTITSPPDKFVTTDASISIAGNVNDIVVGTVNDQQAQVTVNGLPAQVSNRTFLATNVALNLGENVIQAIAKDRVGNFATTQITVTRQVVTGPQIRAISGNNQTGGIGAAISSPLAIALTDSAGNAAPNKPVIFKVTQNDGLVSSGASPQTTVIATSNAQGQAQVSWTLGMRAGAGGNTVEAYAVGFGGTAIFTATGTQGPAGKIVVDTGNDQIGATGQALPKPLIVAVVDSGNNRLGGVPVTFTVKTGGGSLEGQSSLTAPVTFTLTQAATTTGQESVTVTTDSDGRAAAILTLGSQEGNANNLVEATFPNNQGFPAAFTASGRVAGDPAKTAITGAVLDNSNVPIPGVTIRGVLTNLLKSSAASVQSAATVQTDAQGQFAIPQAPVGFVKLLVDGSTAQRPGTYPTLEYDLVTVAGQTNTIGSPVYLLPLNSANQLCVTPTTGGGTLTIPEAPGFSLTFGPGQVTFPGGSKTGCVSVTTVHADKVPMVPGFGQQPRFIVTIQPAGAIFNPPAPITLPNVDGLKPREVTEMYSFDHDIGSFVAIGTGVVSDDGLIIRSSPGVGVLKSGWHCGGNPITTGICETCAAGMSVTYGNNSIASSASTSIIVVPKPSSAVSSQISIASFALVSVAAPQATFQLTEVLTGSLSLSTIGPNSARVTGTGLGVVSAAFASATGVCMATALVNIWDQIDCRDLAARIRALQMLLAQYQADLEELLREWTALAQCLSPNPPPNCPPPDEVERRLQELQAQIDSLRHLIAVIEQTISDLQEEYRRRCT